ncbi:MAG: ABC transporter substrate-binding protein [Beijerinckiaceae bacterium]
MRQDIRIAQPRVVLDDPHACTDSNDVLNVFGALFDALVRRGADGYEPALATGWTVSDDARTFVFQLRKGVHFHNGDACDATAVKFSLERMARPDMGATLGAPGVYSQYLAGIKVEIINPLEVRLTLATPVADLFDILAYGHIISPRAIAAAGDDLAKRAIGTGPYSLVDYVPGETISVKANDAHFDGPPAHSTITWMKGATAETRLAMLLAGEVTIANALPPEAEKTLAATQRFTSIDYLAPTAIICMFNAASGPGADPRVRLALNLALDREGLIRKVLHGAGTPLHGFISPVHYGADANATPFKQDMARAKALLEEAGYASGLTLQVYCPTRLPDEAQALVAELESQFSPLGVRFTIHLEDDRTHYANQVRLKNIHDICVFDSSPMSAFRVLYEKIDSRVKGSWWEGYCNPAVEALLDTGRRTVDTVAREAIYQQCYRLLQQDPPWLYLYNHRRIIAVSGVHGDWHMSRDGVLDVRGLPILPPCGEGVAAKP